MANLFQFFFMKTWFGARRDNNYRPWVKFLNLISRWTTLISTLPELTYLHLTWAEVSALYLRWRLHHSLWCKMKNMFSQDLAKLQISPDLPVQQKISGLFYNWVVSWSIVCAMCTVHDFLWPQGKTSKEKMLSFWTFSKKRGGGFHPNTKVLGYFGSLIFGLSFG